MTLQILPIFHLPCFVLNVCDLRAKTFCQILPVGDDAYFLSIFTT